MKWYRVDITESCILGGNYHRLCRQFQHAFIAAGAPPDMALFVQLVPYDNTRRVFVATGRADQLGQLVEAYGGVPCGRPDGDDVTLVFGVPDAKVRLLSPAATLEREETATGAGMSVG